LAWITLLKKMANNRNRIRCHAFDPLDAKSARPASPLVRGDWGGRGPSLTFRARFWG